MKKKLYLVIGHGKCGKSSLVRSMTGLWRYGLTRIQRLQPSDIINIRVWIRSLQEYVYLPIRALDETLLYQEDFLLMTVRVESINGCPDVFCYLEAFVHHYDIEGIVVIGEHPINEELFNGIQQYCPENTHKFEKSLSTPVNKVCTEVKAAWNWA